jgi:hypothetical protein
MMTSELEESPTPLVRNGETSQLPQKRDYDRDLEKLAEFDARYDVAASPQVEQVSVEGTVRN